MLMIHLYCNPPHHTLLTVLRQGPPGWPRTHYVVQTGLKLKFLLSLPATEITDVGYLTWL
jgi:hypothetical protein